MMKTKTILSLLFISGLLLTSEAFAINDNPKNKTENAIFMEDVENTEYNNDIHSDFSLEDCIRIALKNNLSIQASYLNDAAYKEKIGKEWSRYFPELSAGVDWGRNRDYEIGTYNSALLPSVSANMTVFDFGKIKASADSAKHTYLSKEFETKEHINMIICNTKKAYFNLLFAKAQYDVYQDTVKDFELQKQQAFSLYSAGKKAKVDVAIADYNLCKAKLNFEQAKKTLKVAKYELSRIMGFPKYNNYELTSELGQDSYDLSIDDAMEKAYNIRPELLAIQKLSEAAKMDLRARRRDFTPDIKIRASIGNDVGTFRYTSTGIGANLSYSNFNILRTKFAISEANFMYKKRLMDLEDEKHTLYLSVSRAYESFATAYNSIDIAKSALEQAKEQYRQTKGRYKAGIADIIELKDGENAFLNARLDYYNSLLNYNIAIAEFEKEVGAPIENYSSKKTESKKL
ncbi:MAG: TolC family protein [Candidatus Gastranaerophilales bacterium]|nr:TolC family protein [Candidatus Gastranaerophilales bacterium]